MRITIRFWLYATATGVLILIILLSFIINYYAQGAYKYYQIIDYMNEITRLELSMRKIEKDFIHDESFNPNFFDTHQSIYLNNFEDSYTQIRYNISLLGEHVLFQELGNKSDLTALDTNIILYKNYFLQIVELTYQKGFKDYGLIGQMRDKIHFLEDQLDKMSGQDKFMVHLLMLRRHEKDYLLRKNFDYISKFKERGSIFLRELETAQLGYNQEFKIAQNEYLISLLTEYINTFLLISQQDLIIGFTPQQGLLKKMNSSIHILETVIKNVHTSIIYKAKQKIREAVFILIMLAIAFIIIISIILGRLSRYIVKSIQHLQKHITLLGMGELPDMIISTKRDEIAQMTDSINILIRNLKNTREFAIEVGKGNLDTTINVFDNQGDLGGSLIEMRNRLAEVAREQHKARKESERREWIATKKALFATTLRQHNNDIDKFAAELLSKLLHFIDAPQGGLFIKNQESEYELKASVAYGEAGIKRTKIGQGCLLRKVIEQAKIEYLENLDDETRIIESGSISIKTKYLLIVPLKFREIVEGVLEVGALQKFKPYRIELIESITKDIAATISMVRSNLQTTQLLEQTQEQAYILLERQEEIQQQKEELVAQAEILREMNQTLAIEKEQTAGSIRYAQTIQNAMLPYTKQLRAIFDDYFIIYLPKDIVSGDFYWFVDIPANNNLHFSFIAVIDCTGHGVPGAFMSLIAYSLLNEIVNKEQVYEPSSILELLDHKIKIALRQEEFLQKTGEQPNNDGLDLGLCKVYRRHNNNINIDYAGAKRPLYCYNKQQDTLTEVKGTRRSIGGGKKKRSTILFETNSITLIAGDMIYLSSDGLIDQNDAERKKFGSPNFVELLKNIAPKTTHEQKQHIEQTLANYMINTTQRDDITILGIRL